MRTPTNKFDHWVQKVSSSVLKILSIFLYIIYFSNEIFIIDLRALLQSQGLRMLTGIDNEFPFPGGGTCLLWTSIAYNAFAHASTGFIVASVRRTIRGSWEIKDKDKGEE